MRIVVIVLLSSLFFSVMAQEDTEDITMLQVQYLHKHVFDLTANDTFIGKYDLRIGKKMTRYIRSDCDSLCDILVESSAPKIEQSETIDIYNTIGFSIVDKRGLVNYEQVYQYFNKPFLRYTYEGVGQVYITEITKPDFKWRMSKDTLHILGMVCKKATGDYRGRQYVAWYNPELPFNTGPWKISGLPGLPLYIYDAKHEIEWKAQKIFNDTEQSEISDYLSYCVPIKEKELIKFKMIYEKDPLGFRKSRFGGTGYDIYELHFYDGNELIHFKKLPEHLRQKYSHPYYLINNPIELSDE